ASRDQLYCLPDIRTQEKLGAPQIVLGQQWPFLGVADISAKARRRIRVAALADVVGAKLIVVAEFAGSVCCEEVSWRSGVSCHPERVQVGSAIVLTAGLHHTGLIFNHHSASQLRTEPDSTAGRHVDREYPIASLYFSSSLLLGAPLRHAVPE